MIALEDVERELSDLADRAGWSGVDEEAVRRLARRIAVQIEMQRIDAA